MEPIGTGYPGTYWWGWIGEGRRGSGGIVRHRIVVSSITPDRLSMVAFQVIMAGVILRADAGWSKPITHLLQIDPGLWWRFFGAMALVLAKLVAVVVIGVAFTRVCEASLRLLGFGLIRAILFGAAGVGLLGWGGWMTYSEMLQAGISSDPLFIWVAAIAMTMFAITAFVTFSSRPETADVRTGAREADPIREAVESAANADKYSERVAALQHLQIAVRRFNRPEPDQTSAESAEQCAAAARAAEESLRKRQLADGPL